jgi:hypothetical protein
MAKGKMVKGKNFVEVDEQYDRKMTKKDMKKMRTAGVAKALKESEKEMGYSDKPRVKPQKKGK